jgi:uncharacterized phage protein (TIGR01671 family)
MRQIKFRIWHKCKACFISDEVAIYYDGVIDWLNQDRPVLDNNDVVIQQYTGLKDKNAKEIYEGDLLWRPTVNRTIYLVDFNDENYGWVMGWNLLEYGIIDDKNNLSEFDKVQWSNNSDVVNYPVKSYYYGSSPGDYHEVVGNIFEGIDK